jgi:hypothetical protein
MIDDTLLIHCGLVFFLTYPARERNGSDALLADSIGLMVDF